MVRSRLVLALLAVYLIWGSTYLAIRYALETLPALTMGGVRYGLAGVLLYLWGRWREPAVRPEPRHWPAAIGIGALLMVGGHGGVVWAQQRVPSGLAALLVATEPLWIAVLAALGSRGARPRWPTLAGLIAGFGGVTMLIGNPLGSGARVVDPLGAAALVFAALSWALGSLLASRAEMPRSIWLTNGMQLATGGALLALAGMVRGEWAGLDPGAFSARSIAAFFYLLVFGTMIGFSAYGWLLRHASPTLASTYAFVNPVVAVFLGWLVAGERITGRVLAAAALILAAVVLIVLMPGRGGAVADGMPPDGGAGSEA
jgi:drug/metabolite transporter (DMT)-like permease